MKTEKLWAAGKVYTITVMELIRNNLGDKE
jgi:hypothetical protein